MSNLEEKIDCLKRELALRRSVYPRQIRQERMTQKHAEREIEVMEDILNEYLKVAEHDFSSLPLFKDYEKM